MAGRNTRSRAARRVEQTSYEHLHSTPSPPGPVHPRTKTKSAADRISTVELRDQPASRTNDFSQDLARPPRAPDASDSITSDPQLPSLAHSPPRHGTNRSRKMNSQGDLSIGTQQLSQSIYKSIILRSKSTSVPEDVQYQEPEHSTGTQHTLNEGDEGHIDITSSFVTHNEPPEDLEDSEPVDFSPTQSPQHLTQFPESQRFKTPATAGRKRNYNGEVIDTPVVTRNPLAANGGPTPSRIMGLSQAFAGTQAASSPFSNGLPTVPKSDRPSPNIQIQTRVAMTSSSPLRLLPDNRRAMTEPATRYVSMTESQAERDRQAQLDLENNLVGDESDDFDDDSSVTRRERRQRERDRKFRTQLRAVTSPLSPGLTSPNSGNRAIRSSPVKPSDRMLDEEASPSPIRPDRNTVSNPEVANVEPDSEVETEQEDDVSVDVRRSSQAQQPGEEDKENHVQYVPDTVAHLQRAINGSISQVEASPCVRQHSRIHADPTAHSSEPIRIANSQPSQSHRYGLSSMPVTSSNPDVANFVIQLSQEGVNVDSRTSKDQVGQASLGNEAMTDQGEASLANVDLPRPNSDVSTSIQDHGTIPETGPDLTNRMSGIPGSISTDHRGSSTDTKTTKFDTAPTHQLLDNTSMPLSQGSSQPVVKTPPGRRRRRMLDVSANSSPLKMTPTFNVAQVLQLDADEELAAFLQPSPKTRVTYSNKRRRIENSPDQTRATSHVTPNLLTVAVSEVQPINFDGAGQEREEVDDDPDLSQAVVQPVRQKKLARMTMSRPSITPIAHQRQSIWEPDASPIHKLDLKVNGRKKTSYNSRDMRKVEERPEAAPSSITPNSQNVIAPTDESSSILPTASFADLERSDVHEQNSEDIIAANMVFACFNGKVRAYYPATCLGLAGSDTTKYRIQWEGYEPDEVDSYGVRSLDLRIGDIVKINLAQFPKVPYTIRGFKDRVTERNETITDIRGYRTIVVTPKQRKSLPPRITVESQTEVPIGAVYLDNNMWQQMKNRDFDFSRCPQPRSSGYATPAERASTPNTPSSRNKRQIANLIVDVPIVRDGMFSNMAFAISYDDSMRKNSLVDLVQSNGGTILHDSFHDLLEVDQIVLKPQFAKIGFTALLTERHSRKEKYMQALALGLPCLSGRWIEACIRQQSIVEWQPYLLPAGESAELDGATRSRVLPDMDPCKTTLSEMLYTRPNLLNGSTAIIVIGRGKAEAKRTPYVFLIQALGAGTIHKATDVTAAKEMVESGSSCQWVFVDDKDVEMSRSLIFPESSARSHKSRSTKIDKKDSSQSPSCTVTGNELIVQSLILGKLYAS